MSERRPTLEQHARELLGLPPEWSVYRWEVKGPGVQVTGAVTHEVWKRGKLKGRPDWRKALPETEATITIPDAMHDAWQLQWEADTGKCFKCEGTRKEWAGWSIVDGTKYKDCTRCNATGQKP